ncbi:hypothetical protein QTO34_000768 [Cnephaeus nilssonii]|uniref:Small ribosomal subunit protein uS4 N-terminal domain-containing protein n=1 Tax=Cnephaeus nilssonii TaxID=3371016 RepID=A0AA40IC96_CNENI|nr:hypothetical protein QTO34_000768 [Eptesicus nilssonii]
MVLGWLLFLVMALPSVTTGAKECIFCDLTDSSDCTGIPMTCGDDEECFMGEGMAPASAPELAAAILVRKLNFHKQKLLKQVDFLNWQFTDQNLHKLHVLWPYWLQRRKDYKCYNQLSRPVHELAWLLQDLPKCNLFHTHTLATLLDKLYDLGLVLMCSLLSRALRCSQGLVLQPLQRAHCAP